MTTRSITRLRLLAGAAATTLDGYPMTQKGQAQQVLVLSFVASVFGGLITTLATLHVAHHADRDDLSLLTTYLF